MAKKEIFSTVFRVSELEPHFSLMDYVKLKDMLVLQSYFIYFSSLTRTSQVMTFKCHAFLEEILKVSCVCSSPSLFDMHVLQIEIELFVGWK